MENRKVIGMIIPTTDNSFFSALAHYIESHLAGYGYRMLLCDSNNNSENERRNE